MLIILMMFVACSDKDTANPVSEPSSQPASPPPVIPDEKSCDELEAQQCFECFASENPAGYNAYIDNLITYCYCGVECTETCVEFCDTLDGSVQPNEECGTCVDTVGSDRESQCIADFSTACEDDINCVSFANDGNTCPRD